MSLFLFVLCLTLAISTVSGHASSTQASRPRTTVAAESFVSQPYDILIIGGGTAGLVLANRLTKPAACQDFTSSSCHPPRRVGLLEAGLHRPSDSLIDIPTAGNLLGNKDVGTLVGNPSYDWMFQSVPQAGLRGEVIQYPRGKVLGGSSAIHSMVWQRGSRTDYDAWAYAFSNGPGWSFDGLLPYLKLSENFTMPNQHVDPLVPATMLDGSNHNLGTLIDRLDRVHGHMGPTQISYGAYRTALEEPASQALLNALSDNIGAPFPPNPNPDAGSDSSLPFFGTARSVSPTTGMRSYSASAYLGNAGGVWERPGLSIVTGAVVTRILFDGTVARGVEFISEEDGRKHTAHLAEGGEVILSAGALQTPQILEISGVGNRTLLESLGIEVVLELPEVGENLQDHPVTLSDFVIKDGVETLDWLASNETFAQAQRELFETRQSGALTYTAPLLAPLPLQALTSPDNFATFRQGLDSSISQLEAQGRISPLQRIQYDVLRAALDVGEVGWVEMVLVPSGGVLSLPVPGKAGATVVAIQLHPFGRGSVHINSTDPLAPPLIDPNFLSEDLPWDASVLVTGSKFARKWFSTEPVAALIERSLAPSEDLTVQAEDKEWDAFVRGAVRTTNHPLGTTAMAPRHIGGVVDPTLKVYGLANVRVVDASIIPLTVGVAIQPTVYAIAEKTLMNLGKAADMINSEWGLKEEREREVAFGWQRPFDLGMW